MQHNKTRGERGQGLEIPTNHIGTFVELAQLTGREQLMVVPSDQVEQRERTEVVEKALDTLPERERKVLWARLWEGRSRGDIGREFGVLAGRIRQIEGRAIRRLRRPAVVQLLNTVHGEA